MGAKKLILVRVRDGHVFCTDGNWYPKEEMTFGSGKIPRRYASGGGAAGKQRALEFTTRVEEAE